MRRAEPGASWATHRTAAATPAAALAPAIAADLLQHRNGHFADREKFSLCPMAARERTDRNRHDNNNSVGMSSENNPAQ